MTDERIQCAQQAMDNENTPLQRLEGFISKIEDFHRLMNFLEVGHIEIVLRLNKKNICGSGYLTYLSFYLPFF